MECAIHGKNYNSDCQSCNLLALSRHKRIIANSKSQVLMLQKRNRNLAIKNRAMKKELAALKTKGG